MVTAFIIQQEKTRHTSVCSRVAQSVPCSDALFKISRDTKSVNVINFYQFIGIYDFLPDGKKWYSACQLSSETRKNINTSNEEIMKSEIYFSFNYS